MVFDKCENNKGINLTITIKQDHPTDDDLIKFKKKLLEKYPTLVL